MCPEGAGEQPDAPAPASHSAFSFGGEQVAYMGPKRTPRPASAPRRLPWRVIGIAAGAIAVLAVAVSAIALSGGGGRSNSTAPTVRTPLAQAAYVTTNSPGFKFSLTITGAAGGHEFSVGGEGSLDERSHEGTLHMEVEGTQMTELIKEPYVYVQLPDSSAASGGKPWIKVDLESFAHAVGLGNPIAQNTSPSQILGMLDAGGQVKKLGTGVVRGVQTTHYHALLNYARYAAQLSGEARKATETDAKLLERLTGSDSLPLEVWVDAQGRVRRVTTEVKVSTAAGVLNETVSMELFSFGPQPAVVLPAEAEVSDQTSALDARIAKH